MITKEQHQRNVDFIANLRAGCWKQGQGALRKSDDCYCVEGAACDFSCLGEWVKVEADRFGYKIGDYIGTLCMPIQVCAFFGWPSDEFACPRIGTARLYTMNDALNLSFSEIADIIESWLNAQEVAS